MTPVGTVLFAQARRDRSWVDGTAHHVAGHLCPLILLVSAFAVSRTAVAVPAMPASSNDSLGKVEATPATG
jgi:hypothetical protein